MAEETFSLDGNLPESEYSGLSELPEVKTPMEWLLGKNRGGEGFRDVLLDDVVPKRQELPDWSQDIEEQTGWEKLGKTLTSDGTGQGMNKVGEFFYTVKDSFARIIENAPLYLLQTLVAPAKALGISEQKSTEILNMLDDIRAQQDFEKTLRDYRLGVEPEAISNQFADMVGLMGTIFLGGAALKTLGASAEVAGGIAEGFIEGNEYLSKDLAAQRQRPGGLEQYKGEGLGFAALHGTIAGLIGAKGVEAGMLGHAEELMGRKAITNAFKREFLEELEQTGEERVARRAQNELYGTDTDKQSWWEDFLETGKAALLGGFGGATFGGIQQASNVSRMKEILVDNFGLTKADANKLAWQYLEDSTDALVKNSMALQDLSPKSRVMQFSKEQLMRDGQTEKEADKTLARIRRDIIKEQVKKDEELSKNDFFEQSQTTDGLVEYLREKTGIQVMEDSVIEEEKQNIADRRAELESQLAQTETQTEQPAEKQATETAQEQPGAEQPATETAQEKPTDEQTAVETVTTEETTPTQPVVEETTSTEQAVTEEIKNKLREHFRKVYKGVSDEFIEKYVDEAVEDEINTANKNTLRDILLKHIDEWYDEKTGKVNLEYFEKDDTNVEKDYVNQTGDSSTGADSDYMDVIDGIVDVISQKENPTKQEIYDLLSKRYRSVAERLNLLNAQENAINRAVGIESPVLPVNEDMLTKQDIDTINDKIEEINTKLDELKNVKTDDQKAEYEVGKELNTFQKPQMAKSKYAERVAQQTKTEKVSPILHSVRDMKAAKQAADTLVESEENSAWEMLENNRADTRGFLRAEVAEALKRKIAKIQDPEVRKEQLRRLINAYSDVATRAGQELRALADDSLVDAIRDAAQIETEASRKVKRAVKNKADKVQKKVDKVVKSNKVMTDKKLWDLIKEKMECK